jgi:hypothetical protein
MWVIFNAFFKERINKFDIKEGKGGGEEGKGVGVVVVVLSISLYYLSLI